MAIKINGTVVINDSRYLNNISGFDSTTEASIDAALRAAAKKFSVADSSGTELDVWYGANTG